MALRLLSRRHAGRFAAAAVASLLALVAAGLTASGMSATSLHGATRAEAAVAPPGSSAATSRHRPGLAAVTTRSVQRPVTGWVAVPVATMWTGRHKPRAIDRAAISARPDVQRWLARQSVGQRLGLVDRVMTQALLGDPVRILVRGPRWSRVELVNQTGSRFPHGIIGWVPTAQVTTTAPVANTGSFATVVARRASLRILGRNGHLIASYGTRLPVVATHRQTVVLAAPGVGRVAVTASAVRLRPHPSGAAVVRAAARFLGVSYLWGGMSTYGIDCSGLTYLVYRQMGITLPRDAADQTRLGSFVPRSRLRLGDLVFFGPNSRRSIHHVGIYAGNGLLLHAPHTGDHVRLTRLTTFPDYWGARRYLGS